MNELHFYAALCSGVSALLQGLRHELRERNDKIKLSVSFIRLEVTYMRNNSLAFNIVHLFESGPNEDSSKLKNLPTLILKNTVYDRQHFRRR